MTKWKFLFALCLIFFLAACGDGGESDENNEDNAEQEAVVNATQEVAFQRATEQRSAELTATAASPTPQPSSTATNTDVPTETMTPTDTATATETPSATATETATETPSATPTDTPTETQTPSETPDFQGTIEAAVAGTFTAQPPATEVSVEPITYQLVMADGLRLGFARPQDWSEEITENEAIIQSSDRESGVILQRGSRATLVSLGLLGTDEDLSTALENISLLGQEAEVSSVETLAVDLLGVPTLRLYAEDMSTSTVAYLLTFGEDDYALVVGYAPLQQAAALEQQVVLPLLLSIDRADAIALPQESIPATSTEVAQQPTSAPSEPTSTEVAQQPSATLAEEAPTIAPSEPTATTEVAQQPTGEATSATAPPEGLLPYQSRGLQLGFNYPADALLEQEGPLVVISSAANEDARVVLLRESPEFLLTNQIVATNESPEAALIQLVEEGLGTTPEVETSERFGGPTTTVAVEIPDTVAIQYHIVDFETEWIFILTVAPLDAGEDFVTTLIDPILNSLQITPPIVVEETPPFVFPDTYTNEAFGLTIGILEDTVVTEEEGGVTLQFGEVTMRISLGSVTELLERGVIGSDVGLISALRSVATAQGVEDVTINSERILRFSSSAFTEFEIDGVKHQAIGAIIVDPVLWMIIEVSGPTAAFDEFAATALRPVLDSISVVENRSEESGETSGESTVEAPENTGGEAEIQPTYTPMPTYTPLPTYTQPAP
jgi:hypothetical protein